MVAHELAQGRLIDLMQNVAELVVVATEGEVSAVVLPKGADQSITVLAAHRAVLARCLSKAMR
jgi:hypothetical protein